MALTFSMIALGIGEIGAACFEDDATSAGFTAAFLCDFDILAVVFGFSMVLRPLLVLSRSSPFFQIIKRGRKLNMFFKFKTTKWDRRH